MMPVLTRGQTQLRLYPLLSAMLPLPCQYQLVFHLEAVRILRAESSQLQLIAADSVNSAISDNVASICAAVVH